MFASLIFILPVAYPITALTLNYAPVAIGGALLVILSVWLVTARFWFAGPRTEIENSDVVRVKYWISDPPRCGL